MSFPRFIPCGHLFLLAALLLLPEMGLQAKETVWLSDLDLSMMHQDFSSAHINQSVDGHPLTIGSQSFEKGVGTHANSVMVIDLKKSAQKFSSSVGVDSEINNPRSSLEFIILGDGKLLWRSGVMKAGEAARKVDLEIKGVSLLKLIVTDADDGINYDHGDWADARIDFEGTSPVAFFNLERIETVTPPADPKPRINGPNIFGVRPGSPFLYTIPATGTRPMSFAVTGLPEGLQLNKATGSITGVLKTAGEYKVTLRATNSLGTAEKPFRIVVGNTIALTPPLGWNSWNCWGSEVSQEHVLQSAHAFITKGLRDHGWTYINIDDGWQGKRGGELNSIQPNSKFPDMKALSDEIHGMGLKFGIYSTPWKGSYLGHIGSSCDNEDGTYDWIKDGKVNEFFRYLKSVDHFRYGKYPFIKQDSQQWAAWGVDYLKYDWHPIDVPHTEAIAQALQEIGRAHV